MSEAKMERKIRLLEIMLAAMINTRSRPASLRGPFILTDEELDNSIRRSEQLLIRYRDGDGSASSSEGTRLSDAAPDLLEALKGLYLDLVKNDQDGLVEHVEPMAKARAAIAKAGGWL